MDPVLQWLEASDALSQLVSLVGLVGLGAIVYLFARWWATVAIRKLVQASATSWDDALVEEGVFVRLAYVAPAIVAYYGVQFFSGLGDTVEALIQRVAFATMIAVGVLSLGGVLSAANSVYSRNPANQQKPIKGYLQVLKILLYLVAALLVIATLMDRSPLLFLSGIGAMTAVLLLIFRDTILSLVASVQLTGNEMIHVGDWIEMPQYGADGDVVDVALHTVKVQNWDKTITTIPTHKLIDDSFKNWRGMSLANSRRIKRSLQIDVSSIRFLEPAEIERFQRFALLHDYIASKTRELREFNQQPGRDPAINADIRRLTNIGTFRAYIASYLRHHPKISQSQTLIVRQLASGPDGLPLEVYCFSNDTNWSNYESIQSDLFDHFLAVAPEFGIRIFQKPSGADLSRWAREGEAAN